jgi:hypothetical protein
MRVHGSENLAWPWDSMVAAPADSLEIDFASGARLTVLVPLRRLLDVRGVGAHLQGATLPVGPEI